MRHGESTDALGSWPWRNRMSLGAKAAALCACFAVLGCSATAENRSGATTPQKTSGGDRTDASFAGLLSPASYNQACSDDNDCVGIPVLGAPTACTNCIAAAINKADEAKYDAAFAAAGHPQVLCPCPFASAGCIDGTCQVTYRPPKLRGSQPNP